MKIAVMGAGGVGGLFGARLAQAGYDVSFIARGAHLAALKQDGLKILSEHRGDVSLPVSASEDPAQIGVVDYVFFCVKLWDTFDCIRLIKPLIGPFTTVVSFQNGVEKEDILVEQLGAAHVLGGISYVAATIASPGVICQRGVVQKLIFGELNDEVTPRVLTLHEACAQADIDVELPADIKVALWEKFVCLVALSSLTASTGLPIGIVRENAKTALLLTRVMEEVVAVGSAMGVRVGRQTVEKQELYLKQLAWDVSASMEYDLRQGNRLELPWLAGYVAAKGKELGIATPTLDVISSLLDPFVFGKPSFSSPPVLG